MASSSLPPADAPSPAQSTEGSECSYAAASAGDSSNESIGDDLASSSDDELPPLDYTSMEYVGGNAARMTLEVVLAADVRPGQRIAYESHLGMVEFTVPSDVPGRKFRVDVVPSGNGAWRLASVHAPTTADGSECSRHGSSVGGPTGGREDGDQSTDGSGSSHSSEHLGPATGEVAECVTELCGMQRADGPASSQQARSP